MGQMVSRPLGQPESRSGTRLDNVHQVSAIRSSNVAGIPAVEVFRGEELAAILLARVFAGLPESIWVRLWVGASFPVGAAQARVQDGPRFVLVFNSPQAVCATVLG